MINDVAWPWWFRGSVCVWERSQIIGPVIDLDAFFKGRLCCFPKDPLEDVETWSESVDKVLSCKGERAPLWLPFCTLQTCSPSAVLSSRTDSFPGVPEVWVQWGEHTVLACVWGVQKDQDGPRDDLLGQQDLLRVCPDRSTPTGNHFLWNATPKKSHCISQAVSGETLCRFTMVQLQNVAFDSAEVMRRVAVRRPWVLSLDFRST